VVPFERRATLPPAKPGSLNFPVSDEKPGCISAQNPEVSILETRKSELPYGFKPPDTCTDKTSLPNPLMTGKAPSREGSTKTEIAVAVYGEYVYVKKPAHRRLWTKNEREAMHGQRAADYVQFFLGKGYESFILPREEVKH
jgi:hypothetical protein